MNAILPARGIAPGLAAVLDALPLGCCFLDRDLRLMGTNRVLAAMAGLPPDARTGRSAADLLPGFVGLAADGLRHALEGGAVDGMEVAGEALGAPAAGRSFVASLRPVPAGEGGPGGVLVSFLDVTAQRGAEAALRESESRRREAVALSPQIPWVADAQGNGIEVGPRWTAVTGMTPEEGRGGGWAKALHPDDLPGALEGWSRSLRSGEALDQEYRIRVVDGTWRWFRARAAALRDAEGRLLRWYGSVEDVHDRKSAEMALAARTRELEATQRIAKLGFWTWRVGTQEFDWSDECYRIHARDPARFRPTLDSTLACLHPEDREPTMQRLLEAVRDKATYDREFRIVRPDGSVRRCWAEVNPELDERGNVVLMHGVCQDITARRLADEALRESEEHYRHSVELSPHIPWIADPDGHVIGVGPRWLALMGMTRSETLGEGWTRALHPDDLAATIQCWRAATRSGEAVDMEYRLRLADGGWRWFRARAAARRDAKGQILRWYGTLEDTHDRRTAEAALRESEARFRAMFEQAGVAIAEVGLGGEWLRVNPCLCELTGYSQDELIGRTFRDITHPDDLGPEIAQMQALVSGRLDSYRAEKRCLARNGGVVWVLLTMALVRDEDDAPAYCICVMKNISARKRAEAALRESEERYRYAVELSPQIPWTAAPDGAVLEVGSRWTAVTGLSYEESLARGWLRFVHADDLAAAQSTWALCLASGEPLDMEYRIRRPDGSWRWLRARAAPRRDAEGRILRWYGMAEDVTDRRTAEDALRESEAFARSVLENSPDCMKVVDLDGHLLFMSGPGLQAMEIDDFAPLCGRAWDGLWPAEGAPWVRQAVREARAGRTARFIAFCPTAKGRPKWWDVSVSAIPGPDGLPVRLLAVSHDVTEAKRAQDEIERVRAEAQAAAQRLSAVLESTTDGVILLDRDWRITYVNGHTTRLLAAHGLTLGARLSDTFPAEVEGIFHQHYKQAMAGQVPLAFEEYFAPLDMWLEVHAYPTAEGGLSLFFRDITEQRKAERERLSAQERMTHMARHDALTGLPNRAYMRERLDLALADVRRGGRIAVLYLDLDGFKTVNDSFGHPMGDALLRQVADRLRRCVRQADMVARFGGDEFAVIQAAQSPPDDAATLARRLVAALGEPYDLDGQMIVISTSVGIALAPEDGAGADDLIKRADLALYAAKAAGRSTYRFYEQYMDEGLRDRQTLKTDLRAAFDHQAFELHYQPILDLHTTRIVSFEALLRWRHPQRGLVPPSEFIPAAEETGLILPIGVQALRDACREATGWPARMGVAVNLSSVQFRSRDLVRTVADVLAETGLTPDRLELEITESVLLQDSEGNLAILRALKGLGIRIAMDDFGTGYSSLGYLRRFPFDKIKIDRSFVSDLPGGGESSAIVRAVVGLGASLGVTITAEGIETQAQLECLCAEGCDQAQGYLFSAPVAGKAVADLIARLEGPRPGRSGPAAAGRQSG